MRKFLLGLTAAAALFVFPITGFSQSLESSVSNCGKLAKIKIGWASVEKVIAEPIVKLAKDPSPGTCAAN
jgi:hypothetical protein